MTETAVAPREQGMKFDALVIRGKDGIIKNVRSNVKLSVEDGTLVKMGSMTEEVNGQKVPIFMVTAAGAREQAQMSGVMALQPKSIIVNGTEQPNNYQDPQTGKVYSESVAIGYTKLGQLTAVKRMMIYDAELANIQDLIAKGSQKWNKEFFKMAPTRRDKDGNLKPPEGCDDMWAGYEVDQAMTIWVNCAAPSVMSWQREMVNKRDKAIRTCQTFAERNALFAHPNMPKKKKYHRAEATATCHTWYAAEGQLRYDLTKLEIDGDKLLEAAPVEDERTVDLNEEIDREERIAADDVIDETDVQPEEAPVAEEEDGMPDSQRTPPPESKDDQIPMETKPPKQEQKKKDKEPSLEERKECIDEIRAMIMKGKPSDKKRQKANTAVKWNPEEARLEELTTEDLITLRSLYKASI